MIEGRDTGNADWRRREIKVSQRHPLPSKGEFKRIGWRIASSPLRPKSEPAVEIRISVDQKDTWPLIGKPFHTILDQLRRDAAFLVGRVDCEGGEKIPQVFLGVR